MSEAREKLQKFAQGTPGSSVAKESRRDQVSPRKVRPFPAEVTELLAKYDIKPPKKFDVLPKVAQLDYIATRILAKSRTTTSHREMREEGILSVSQYERRLHREVYSNFGTLNNIQTVEMQQGVFGRVFPKSKNEYVHGDKARQREYVRKHL